jgi:hypothetical protein
MVVITGTLMNGRIVLDESTDWPDGSRVIVLPVGARDLDVDSEVSQSNDPESIVRWLAEFDAIPPWEFTPEEEARWRGDREAVKRYTIEKMASRWVDDQQ